MERRKELEQILNIIARYIAYKFITNFRYKILTRIFFYTFFYALYCNILLQTIILDFFLEAGENHEAYVGSYLAKKTSRPYY